MASNESEYPFLDEGLASYTEWRFLQVAMAAPAWLTVMGLRLSRNAGGRFAALYDRGAPVAINQPARDFPSFQSLAREVYGRTPLVLEDLHAPSGAEPSIPPSPPTHAGSGDSIQRPAISRHAGRLSRPRASPADRRTLRSAQALQSPLGARSTPSPRPVGTSSRARSPFHATGAQGFPTNYSCV